MTQTVVRDFNAGSIDGWTTPHTPATITHDTAVKQEGTGSVKVVRAVSAGWTQHRSGLQWPSTTGIVAGNVMDAYVRLASTTPGSTSGWRARIWWQSNASPYTIYTASSWTPLVSDGWVRISFDFGTTTPLETTPGWVGVEVQNDNVISAGNLTYNVDLFRKGDGESTGGGGGGGGGTPDPSGDTLTVTGNKLYHNGVAVNANGTNVIAVFSTGIYTFYHRDVNQQLIDQLKNDWKLNIVRLSFDQTRWLNETTYRNTYNAGVRLFHQNGFIVMPNMMTGKNHAHSDENTPTLWTQFTQQHLDLKNLIIEPYNEPAGVSWSVWGTKGQALVDAVRNAGGRWPILLNCTGWANAGDSAVNWRAYKPTDPLNRLLVGWHTYDWTGDDPNQPIDLADDFPVIIGEYNVHKDNRSNPGWITNTFYPNYVAPIRNKGATCIPISWMWAMHDQYSDTGMFTQQANNQPSYNHPNTVNAVRDPNATAMYNWGLANPTTTFALTTGTGGDTTAPTISNGPTVDQIGPTSARVVWTLSENATGKVEYGLASNALTMTSTPETTYNYSTHVQSIGSMQPETTYYYRVVGQDAAGNAYASTVSSFTTAELPASNTRVCQYYVDWKSDSLVGHIPVESIPWDTCTHLMVFSVTLNANGVLSNPWTNAKMDAIIAAANTNGKKAILVLGGAGRSNGSGTSFNATNRATFVANVKTILDRGFHGVDFDIEGGGYTNADFIATVQAMRTAIGGTKEIHVTIGPGSPGTYLTLEPTINSINLMTYDNSGLYPGWTRIWPHGALDSAGYTHPSTGGPMPGAKQSAEEYFAAGWPKSKITIGIPLYGYRYRGGSGTSTGGVTMPGQVFTNPPVIDDSNSYRQYDYDYIVDTWITPQPSRLQWFEPSKNDYLANNMPNDADDWFVTFDGPRAAEAKFDFMRDNGYGGVIVWYMQAATLHPEPLNALAARLSGQNNADTTPPVISGLAAIPSLQGAELNWNTNESSSTQIEYGLTNTFGSFTQVTDTNPRTTVHYVQLTNLQPNTQYFYRPISIDGSGNVATGSTQSFVTLPLPVITSLNPNAVTRGVGTTTVQVIGQNFSDGVTAYWETTSLPTARVSATELQVTVAASLLTVAGTFNMRVAHSTYNASTNPVAISSPATFTVNEPTVVEVNTSSNCTVVPDEFTSGEGPALLTINSTTARFQSGDFVTWNGSARTTQYNSPQQIIFYLDEADKVNTTTEPIVNVVRVWRNV